MFKDVMMLGGGKEIKSAIRSGIGTNKLSVMALLVLFFILKVLVVQMAYNTIVPKLTSNFGNSTQQFKPLTFEEALMLTLLTTFLY